MKAAESTPALGVSLNISGANFGIAFGALLGSQVIDGFGLPWVGFAAAILVLAAIAVVGFAIVLKRRRNSVNKMTLPAKADIA